MNPRRKNGLVFVATVVVTGIVAWLVMGRPSLGGAEGSTSAGATRDVVQQYAPGDRPSVSSFGATLLDGSSLSDSDLRGTVTVLNVWGSWCGPCRAEAPELVDAARRLKGRAQFFGINVRDSPDAARAFERAFDIPYPSVRPADSARTILAFRGVLTAAAVPSTVIVDRDGAVAARVVGQVDASTLVSLVRDASDGADG